MNKTSIIDYQNQPRKFLNKFIKNKMDEIG